MEPSNTWSNLAYIAVGLVILWHRRAHLKSPLTLIGVTGVLVGIGSFAFHATGTFLGEVLDVSAMYLISGLLLVFAFKRRFGWTDRRIWQIYWALTFASIAILLATRVSGIPVFALQIAAVIFIEAGLYRGHERGTINYRPKLALISCFAAAFTAWALDITGIVCNPDNHIFTGHAFWHVSNSLCLWFFYAFQKQFEQPHNPHKLSKIDA